MAIAREINNWSASSLAETESVADMLASVLGRRRIIVASNRGPIQYSVDRRGELVAERGQGGLVTALTSLLRYARVAWVASTMTAGDREAARRLETASEPASLDDYLRLRLVDVADKAYERHYQVFANPLLWLVQHSMANELIERPVRLIKEAWRWGYLPVNRAMARGILAELDRADTAPLVFIHDYHLYLTSQYVRERAPHAFLQHFIHIPWPAPGYGLRWLGPVWREILQGLLCNDIIGFQTESHVRNFLYDCRSSLPDVRVDPDSGTAYYRGRMVRVRAYPISVDVASLREQAMSDEVLAYRRKLEPFCGEMTIVKVERVDPTKNTLAGLVVFRRLLEGHPELVGKARLLAFLVPSRTGIPEYRSFHRRLMATVDSINAEFGCGAYQPIHVFYENNYLQALAGMSLYDALLVNPLADGMNLVAKEGPILNQKDGVLVLSEGAGAHSQLAHGALSIDPSDIDGTVRTLFYALTMPKEERKRRALLLRSAIEAQDLIQWLTQQFRDALVMGAGPTPVLPVVGCSLVSTK